MSKSPVSIPVGRQLGLLIIFIILLAIWFTPVAWQLFGQSSMHQYEHYNYNAIFLFKLFMKRIPHARILLSFGGAAILAFLVQSRCMQFRHAMAAVICIAAILFAYWWTYLFGTALFILFSAALGMFLMRAMSIVLKDTVMPITFFAIGLIPIVLFTFLLSAFHLFNFRILAVFAIGGIIILRQFAAAILAHVHARCVSFLNQPMSFATVFSLLVTSIFILVTLLFAIHPTLAADSVPAHEAFSSVFVRIQQIPFLMTTDFSGPDKFTALNFWMIYPFNMDVILSCLYAFGGTYLCQVFQAFMLLLTCICMIEFAAVHLKNLEAGCIAAMIFSSVPVFNLTSATTHVEIDVALFGMLAVIHTFNYLEHRNLRSIIIASLILGFSLGVKVFALFWIAPLAVLIWFRELVVFRNVYRAFLYPMLFSMIACALGAPYYLRNYLLTGDPLFPVSMLIGSHIYERPFTLVSYLYDAFFNPGTSNSLLGLPGAMGFNIFALLPAALYFATRRLTAQALSLAVLGVTFIYFSYYSIMDRYALPLYPLPILALSYGFVGFKSIAPRPLRFALTMFVIGISVMNILYFRCWTYHEGPPSNNLTGTVPYDKLFDRRADYHVGKIVNRHVTDPRDRIIVIGWDFVAPGFFDGLLYNSGVGVNAKAYSNAMRVGARQMTLDQYHDYLKSNAIKLLIIPESLPEEHKLAGIEKNARFKELENNKQYKFRLFRVL